MAKKTEQTPAKTSWLAQNWLLLLTGFLVGAAAIVLNLLGNPGNMGFCIACFERDIAGALGLHSAAPVQYFRPEIVGIVLGSLLMALARKEFVCVKRLLARFVFDENQCSKCSCKESCRVCVQQSSPQGCGAC